MKKSVLIGILYCFFLSFSYGEEANWEFSTVFQQKESFSNYFKGQENVFESIEHYRNFEKNFRNFLNNGFPSDNIKGLTSLKTDYPFAETALKKLDYLSFISRVHSSILKAVAPGEDLVPYGWYNLTPEQMENDYSQYSEFYKNALDNGKKIEIELIKQFLKETDLFLQRLNSDSQELNTLFSFNKNSIQKIYFLPETEEELVHKIFAAQDSLGKEIIYVNRNIPKEDFVYTYLNKINEMSLGFNNSVNPELLVPKNIQKTGYTYLEKYDFLPASEYNADYYKRLGIWTASAFILGTSSLSTENLHDIVVINNADTSVYPVFDISKLIIGQNISSLSETGAFSKVNGICTKTTLPYPVIDGFYKSIYHHTKFFPRPKLFTKPEDINNFINSFLAVTINILGNSDTARENRNSLNTSLKQNLSDKTIFYPHSYQSHKDLLTDYFSFILKNSSPDQIVFTPYNGSGDYRESLAEKYSGKLNSYEISSIFQLNYPKYFRKPDNKSVFFVNDQGNETVEDSIQQRELSLYDFFEQRLGSDSLAWNEKKISSILYEMYKNLNGNPFVSDFVLTPQTKQFTYPLFFSNSGKYVLQIEFDNSEPIMNGDINFLLDESSIFLQYPDSVKLLSDTLNISSGEENSLKKLVVKSNSDKTIKILNIDYKKD